MAAIGGALASQRAFAGPFQAASKLRLEVPADKMLSSSWVRSLYAPGPAEPVSGAALRHVGMPIGGICAGMVYLSGDGRLWHWDIFNQNKTGVTQSSVRYAGRELSATEGAAYVQPLAPVSELSQGFWLTVDGVRHSLDSDGWGSVKFVGQYPVGRVSYQDSAVPVSVDLEAFSPFIPLNEDDSALPVTLMSYRVHNRSSQTVELELGGHLENAIGHTTFVDGELEKWSETIAGPGVTGLHHGAKLAPQAQTLPDIEVERWSEPTYVGWKVEGSAFGKGPVLRKDVPDYQGELGGPGDRVVNSHASAPGNDVNSRDSATGKLTGLPFALARNYLHFWIGGGDHPGETCLNLWVDGQIVGTKTGANSNKMEVASIDVSKWKGKQAHIEIVDIATGGWGHIGVGRIWQSDRTASSLPVEQRSDFGTMALAVLGSGKVTPQLGSVAVGRRLGPGETFEATFAIAWHFPNLKLGIADDASGRWYAKRFSNAADVVRYVAKNRQRLMGETRLWNRTWYDSTLPAWFLDRTFLNTSILATTTAHRFGTGRFYAWEGVGCCAGTCTHVWHYAQAVGRIFPALERDLRERVDYGVAFHEETGAIGFRAEFYQLPAVDGRAGSILRTCREHRMSANSEFLHRVWPRARRAMEFLIGKDPHAEGILSGAQDNTLDAAWFGKIAWTSSLYNAALLASAEMADEMEDAEFAARCRQIASRGKSSIQTQLFNGEYFIQTRDPANPHALGTYNACHIDQVLGEAWARQLGLPRVLDRDKTLSALHALYRYNFAPDVGPFRQTHPEGRWYAVAGDGGLLMVTNPRGDKDPYGDRKAWQFGYFNECMSGFEHQVAAHMIAEGMVEEGLVVTRAIHDRYAAALRNPYNEIECSDHYARAMASYGSFVSICGFEYHGPKGLMGFAPKLKPENFRAPFVAAEGWGTYSQRITDRAFEAEVATLWGTLKLRELELSPGGEHVERVEIYHGSQKVECKTVTEGGKLKIRLTSPLRLTRRDVLRVKVLRPI